MLQFDSKAAASLMILSLLPMYQVALTGGAHTGLAVAQASLEQRLRSMLRRDGLACSIKHEHAIIRVIDSERMADLVVDSNTTAACWRGRYFVQDPPGPCIEHG